MPALTQGRSAGVHVIRNHRYDSLSVPLRDGLVDRAPIRSAYVAAACPSPPPDLPESAVKLFPLHQHAGANLLRSFFLKEGAGLQVQDREEANV